MSALKKFLVGGIASAVITGQVLAASDFIIRSIQIEGLSGISKGTVLNYMPISVGDRFTEEKSAEIIQALYGSGFFTNVALDRSGNTLIVKVSERAAIGAINIRGNKAIKKKDIQQLLKEDDLTLGNVYSVAKLQAFKGQLQDEYYELGYYNTQINTQIQPLPRNRVGITININEGGVAKIRRITIIGNQAFSDYTLRHQLLISTPTLFSYFTKSDQYSKQKLDASLEKLRSYYMNRGYIRFKILSAHAALASNHESVYVTIRIEEGPQYRFGQTTVSGTTVVPREKLFNAAHIKPGDVFSQQVVEQAEQNIALVLGDQGYAFTHIEPIPRINEQNRTVDIDFHLSPGPKVYVRRVIFKGNTITADYVLRRSILQMEGGLLITRQVRQSVRQLNLLGYFKNVQVKTVPVPGTNNQVDLIYDVQETPSGKATFSIGYGTLGLELGAGINQPNFLGTGKTVGLNFDYTRYATTYSLTYYNPYHTINNIGVGYTIFYTKTHPKNYNLADYSTDTYGLRLNTHIPLSLNTYLNLGASYQHIQLNELDLPTPQLSTFIKNNGTRFNVITTDASYNYNGLDRIIFPTKGLTSTIRGEISLPVFGDNLEYYKVSTFDSYYLPLNYDRTFIVKLRGGVGYGNGYGDTDILPFFFNYYAGGLAQGLVRGYESNSLGPRDSRDKALGGNFLITYGASLIFPNHISPDSLRTAVFVDAGNVYQTVKNVYGTSNLYSGDEGTMRYSAGLAVEWRSPLGPLEFSLAKPLNAQKDDEKQFFQFTMGTSF